MIIWLHQRWKWCLEFVGCERSTRRICFYRLSCMLQVWHKLIWEKAITKKRITILMKVSKIKTSLLSLTLEPGNESLVRSIMFLLSEKTRTQNKIWGDLITTSTLLTAVTNTRNYRENPDEIGVVGRSVMSTDCLINHSRWVIYRGM